MWFPHGLFLVECRLVDYWVSIDVEILVLFRRRSISLVSASLMLGAICYSWLGVSLRGELGVSAGVFLGVERIWF